MNAHTKTDSLLIHSAKLNDDASFANSDTAIPMVDEPDHDELCAQEQAFFARAIHENLDLTDHINAALRSLQIVLAADESMRTGEVVRLE